MELRNAILKANVILKDVIDSVNIVLVAHVLGPRGYDNMKQLKCSETEHFSVQEFNEIYQGIVNAGFFISKVFFSEIEFIQDALLNPYNYESALIFNLCRNGLGMNKKTVVPAFCDLVGIRYTSSGAGQCALARNKLLITSILESNGIKCPISGFTAEDMIAHHLPSNATVIFKPNNESASQGVSENSVKMLCEVKNNGDNLIQEYIEGYECEVPVFMIGSDCFALDPVGIKFGQDELTGILSYEHSKNNNYSFYPLDEIVCQEVCEKIRADAVKAFQVLGLKNYGRVDFRIGNKTKQHYVIDISTTPYITQHSSFAFAINHDGKSYSDIFKIIFSAAL